MSTFGKTALAAIALVIFAAPAGAQRHARHTRSYSAPTRAIADTQCTYEDCGGDYALGVVSALYPFSEASASTSSVLTLVVQNTGTERSPQSEVTVAPRGGFTLASREVIPSLAPGERTVVKVPLAVGPDGFSCVSIAISSAPRGSTQQTLASAAPATARTAPPTRSVPPAPTPTLVALADPDPFLTAAVLG